MNRDQFVLIVTEIAKFSATSASANHVVDQIHELTGD